MRREAAEQPGGDDLRTDLPADLGGVVEHGPQRHAPEELEDVAEPLADALGGLAPEHLREADVGVRESHYEEVPALHDAAHAEVGLPEVDLALAGQPVEQQEPLRLARVRLGLATLAWTVSRGPMEGGSMADPKHPRHFTDDFKRQIVSLYNAGKPPSEIMREYDLGSTTLRR